MNTITVGGRSISAESIAWVARLSSGAMEIKVDHGDRQEVVKVAAEEADAVIPAMKSAGVLVPAPPPTGVYGAPDAITMLNPRYAPAK